MFLFRRWRDPDLDLVDHLDRRIAELGTYLAAQADGDDRPGSYPLRPIPASARCCL